jgi:hypothetical protein
MNKIYFNLSGKITDQDMDVFFWFLVRVFYAPTITRADFVLDQSAHLFTFSFSANHNPGNEKFTPKRARKYCRLLGLP